jgi:D-alanine-D-alanine ligase
MSKTHVAVFMGGRSEEHEVSLKSGGGVLRALQSAGYEATPVTVGRDGSWSIGEDAPRGAAAAMAALESRNIDCAFIALHGPYGEDGRLQGLFDMTGLPYTGSGCAASALAMDKVRCKAVVSAQGIRVAGHLGLDRPTWAIDAGQVTEVVENDIGFPCVIKAVSQGSSKGIAICDSILTFRQDMERVLDVEDYVMVEAFVKGTEVTCSVLDADPSGRMRPLPVTEICPKNARYFDYDAKYTPGATDEITPARIPQDAAELIMDMAVHAHEVVGCSGWSRSDFIIDEEGPVWIEVNTIPGLTETSLFPQAAEAAGISYEQLITALVDDALRRAEVKKVSV